MANILAVGIATLDIINTVDAYPTEDDEVRALAQRISRGGNATNTLVVLSQLGHACRWAGVVANEKDGERILDDLKHHRIGLHAVQTEPTGKVPTSYVTLNQRNGSRTIVHYRDIPEYASETFRRIALADIDWLHFEGRNIEQTHEMMTWAKQQARDLPISLEVEKPRDAIERLFPLADVIVFSKGFAKHRGFRDGATFLRSMQETCSHAKTVCTWGSDGSFVCVDEIDHIPAFPPPQIVDTLGAGDTFNAGLIHALVNKQSFVEAARFASRLAGQKCASIGFNLELIE